MGSLASELAAFAERELVRAEMERLKVTVTPQEIDDEMKRLAVDFAKRNGIDPKLLTPEALGRKLGRVGFAARRFYGPHHRLYFALARLSRRAQELGADWYNGAARLDEMSVAGALGRWARAVLFRAPLR